MYGRMLVVAVVLLAGCGGEGRSDLASSVAVAEPMQDAERPGVERRIVYTATIDLVVPDFARTQQAVTALVAAAEGYVAAYREDTPSGGQRGGRWVVRLPVSQFEPFTTQVLTLGVPISRESDAQDVTEKYIDLTSRLHNKQRLEERVLNLLDARTGEIKDVIEVEAQLGRIREEIESLEGKLRFLSDRVAMTTVTLSAREDRSYTPPQSPTFAAKASGTLWHSLDALRQLGEGIVLAAVAAAPWLVVVGLFLTPAALWWRRR